MNLSDLWQVGGFLHQQNWLPQYNWNIVESGVKHHKPKPLSKICLYRNHILVSVYLKKSMIHNMYRLILDEGLMAEALGAIMVIIVLLLDLQLPMQSVAITAYTLWVQIQLNTRCTRYNIMWWSLLVTYSRSVVFSGYYGFLCQ